MARALLSLAGFIALTAPAAAEPLPLGKTVQVEFTDKLERGDPLNQSAFVWTLTFDYPIDQGDKFRIEMEPVGGADMIVMAGLGRDVGKGAFGQYEFSASGSKVGWTSVKGLTGKHARVCLYSKDLGKINVRITRIGADGEATPAEVRKDVASPTTGPAVVGRGGADDVAKLRADVEALKKQNADLQRQIEELRKAIGKK